MENKTDFILYKDIKDYMSFVKIEPINQGLSTDKKYYIESCTGERLLLRVADISEYARNESIFSVMKHTSTQGVPVPRPIDFGICNNGKKVYQLTTWCDGYNLKETLPSLPKTEQYALGIKAGEILHQIHTIPAPGDLENWSAQYLMIVKERLESFTQCGVSINGSDSILHYFETHKHLLQNRPLCLLHGDYHRGNLLVTNNHMFSVLDWEAFEYGDPWLDFDSINDDDVIPAFTTGLVRGYFAGEPPTDFWPLLALYLSVGALSLISWAFYRQRNCLDYCIDNANNVLRWFDNMNSLIPAWYLKASKADF